MILVSLLERNMWYVSLWKHIAQASRVNTHPSRNTHSYPFPAHIGTHPWAWAQYPDVHINQIIMRLYAVRIRDLLTDSFIYRRMRLNKNMHIHSLFIRNQFIRSTGLGTSKSSETRGRGLESCWSKKLPKFQNSKIPQKCPKFWRSPT